MTTENDFRLALGLVLCFLFSSFSFLFAQDVSVSEDCAPPNSNGFPYIQSGTVNGRNQYVGGVCTKVIKIGNPKDKILVLYPNPSSYMLVVPAITGKVTIYN